MYCICLSKIWWGWSFTSSHLISPHLFCISQKYLFIVGWITTFWIWSIPANEARTCSRIWLIKGRSDDCRQKLHHLLFQEMFSWFKWFPKVDIWQHLTGCWRNCNSLLDPTMQSHGSMFADTKYFQLGEKGQNKKKGKQKKERQDVFLLISCE